jgi:hypothetical protein
MTVLGQYMTVHIVVVGALTFLYGRRKSEHSIGASILVIVAWILPILGPIFLAAFLAGVRTSKELATE